MQNPTWGAIWENLVVGEARKWFLNAGRRPPCWFWRTVQGEEIDLLVERGPSQFLAVECKVAAEIEPRALKAFAALEQAYGPKALRRGAVICRTPSPYPLSEGGRIEALPLGGEGGLVEWIARHLSR